jgi:protein-export membrane protein SecD
MVYQCWYTQIVVVEEDKMIWKNPRILIWIFFVIVSIILISPNPNPRGYVVTYIQKNSTLEGIGVGDVIYTIDNKEVTKEVLEKEYYDTIKIETSAGAKFVRVNGSLGISVETAPFSNLKFGLDLKGGVRALIEPNTTDNETMDQMISTLQTRINVYGLRESIFRPVYYEDKGFIEVSMAGGTREELKELLEHQGRFEAKIPVILDVADNKAAITLDRYYLIYVDNNSISINNITAVAGDSFTLSGIQFHVESIGNKLNMTSTVFTGKDIVTVFFDPQRSRIEQSGDGYNWYFSVKVSNEGAEKFAWVTQNIPIAKMKVGDSNRYLESMIYLYLDGKLIDDLNIVSDLKGKIATEVMITGWANSVNQASKTKSQLQSILRSGALPASIKVVQMDTVSPTLGMDFLKSAIIAGGIAILVVSSIALIRYRKIKFMLPMILVSMSEVLIILGVAVIINWTIDLAAIAGIIAAVGTGIDAQIIILDQSLRKEQRIITLKEKIERAFFIIFGAGGTTIAAMLPLMTIGFGLLRGFAITTIIGVLAGILIARPAFGVIVRRLVGE